MKKLSLKRESIRQLSFAELENVGGAKPKNMNNGTPTEVDVTSYICVCNPPSQSDTCGSCEFSTCDDTAG